MNDFMPYKISLDHVYISVVDMYRAISFYEKFLGEKIVHREGNTWADFDRGNGFYLGLIDPKIVDEKRSVGNNAVIVFLVDDVDQAFKKVEDLGCHVVSKPEDLTFTDYPYRCFHFHDSEGNLIEVAWYGK